MTNNPRTIRIKLDKDLRFKGIWVGGEVPDKTVESVINGLQKALEFRRACTEDRKKDGISW